jgi:SAM-dependent methyltransferase
MASLYDDLAKYYDPIYTMKDYGHDAALLRDVLKAEGVEDGARFVEAACGTGSYLVPLAEWYEVEGYDLEPAMLAIAEEKLPDVPLRAADMCEHVLDEPADVVACLFSSIGYAYPVERMRSAIRCFAESVRPGGVVAVGPWIDPADCVVGQPNLDTYEDEDLKLARACVMETDDRLCRLEMHWLAVRRNEGTEHFVDVHNLMMYTREEYLAAFAAAGLEARFLTGEGVPERGLYLGIRS